MNELISVIINVYNGEKFIKKCVDSVINQTYTNLEILIINDGSTDNTLEICESYEDDRIKVITTKNMGLSLSRNVGIDNATGSYLYFVDSDDYISNDTIEYLYELCKKYNSKFATCVPLTVFDYNATASNKNEKINILTSYEMLKKVLILEDMSGTTWNKLIHKDLFENIRFENRIINDVVVTYKLVIKAESIVYSNQIKYFYVKHKNAITTNGYEKPDRSIDFYKATFERYENIKKIYPNLIENELGVIKNIIQLHLVENKQVAEYLEKKNAIKQAKRMFTLKMLKCRLKLKEKVKLVLFILSPKICKMIYKQYQKKRSSRYKF